MLPEHGADARDAQFARVLLHTARTVNQFRVSFTAPASQTLALVATKNIANLLLLIGIRRPSMDPAASRDWPCHQQLLTRDLRVLENRVLGDAPEEDCDLVALPPQLARVHALPVRAVLRELS